MVGTWTTTMSRKTVRRRGMQRSALKAEQCNSRGERDHVAAMNYARSMRVCTIRSEPTAHVQRQWARARARDMKGFLSGLILAGSKAPSSGFLTVVGDIADAVWYCRCSLILLDMRLCFLREQSGVSRPNFSFCDVLIIFKKCNATCSWLFA